MSVETTPVVLFDYNSNKIRTILKEGGSIWFVAKDVCRVLEIENHRDSVAKVLDEDEKGVDKIYSLGGPQEMATISESGLYTLIIRSNKPEAKPFRRWVTHEVLPSLRKTGQYSVPGTEEDAADHARMISEAISQLNDGLMSVTASVRALNAAHGGGAVSSGVPGNGGPSTVFGIRPVSRAIMMRDESVRDFMEECCHIHPDASCKPMELHEAYLAWCREGKVAPLGRNTFYKSLRAIATRAIFASRSVSEENGSITCIRVAHGICLNRDGRYFAVAWEGGAI